MKNVVYPDSTTYRAWQRLVASGEPVCPAWQKDFVNFLSDMGVEPTTEHVLTRKDPTVEHRLANTRWAVAPAAPVAPAHVASARGIVRRAINALRRRIGR